MRIIPVERKYKDIAFSTNDLLKDQITYNLDNYITSKIAAPAQISIASGTASTAYSITPSASYGIVPVVTAVNSFTQAVGAGNSSVGGTATKNSPGVTGGISATGSWNQSYIYTTVTDNERFLRLNALYRFAVSNKQDDIDGFVPIHKTITTSTPTCISNANFVIPPPDSLSPANPGDKPGNHCINSLSIAGKPVSGQTTAPTASFTSKTKQEAFQKTDEWFASGIGCITCKLTGDWLRWTLPNSEIHGVPPERAAVKNDIFLADTAHYKLYVAEGRGEDYLRFVAAVLAALNASTSSNAAGGGGATSGQGGQQQQKQQFVPEYFQQIY